MNIFIVADTLLTGGAEWFLLRKCQEFKKRGYDVSLIVLRADKTDKRLLKQFQDIKPLHAPLWIISFTVFLDRILNKVFRAEIFFNWYSALWLRRLISLRKPNIIHSHLLAADYIAAKANKFACVRHIITIHGDYIELVKRQRQSYLKQIDYVFKSLHRIVVITEKQRQLISELYPSVVGKIVKIYNGYDLQNKQINHETSKYFTFGMIARGIPEKGWKYAIEAFQNIKTPNMRLLLYGEGVFLYEIEKESTDPQVLFCGFTNDPLGAISQFDVGLFPSYHPTESLPTTIIEYLALHKPILTTDVGECKSMIQEGDELAGIIIPMKEDRPDIRVLQEQMLLLSKDKELYNKMAVIASKAKVKFDLQICIDKYLSIYKN